MRTLWLSLCPGLRRRTAPLASRPTSCTLPGRCEERLRCFLRRFGPAREPCGWRRVLGFAGERRGYRDLRDRPRHRRRRLGWSSDGQDDRGHEGVCGLERHRQRGQPCLSSSPWGETRRAITSATRHVRDLRHARPIPSLRVSDLPLRVRIWPCVLYVLWLTCSNLALRVLRYMFA